MKPQLRLAAAAVLALSLTAACSDSDSPSSSSSSSASAASTHAISTVKGEVVVPSSPKRVLVLNYSLAGYVYDLGLPVSTLVPEATDSTSKPREAWAEDFAADGTEFISWPAAGFDLEEITAADPDLIIGGGLGFPFKQASDAYDNLSAIAPTVLVDNTLDTWQKQFEWLAESFDKPEIFTDAVDRYDARIEAVKENITVPQNPVTFLSITDDQRAFVLIEGRGLPAEFARLGLVADPLFATGKYAAYVSGGDSFELSPELLPTVITQPTVFVMGFNRETFDVAALREQPIWAALPAFTANRAYDLPYWVQRPDFDRALETLDVVETLLHK